VAQEINRLQNTASESFRNSKESAAGIGAKNFTRPVAAETSTLTLAYIGDSFYELIVRTFALKQFNGSAGEVSKNAKKYSNAAAQAEIARLIIEELSEEELRVFKRGRNAKSISAPHTCTISEYRIATGLEALCGYLFLEEREERAIELVHKGIELYERADG
jgi:ribonuclease-3 family protein